MRPYRSLLFVPGHKPAWAVKAVKSGADAVVFDLEDSVPAGEKDAARATVAATIAEVRGLAPDVGLFVRPNALSTRLAGGDLEAVVVPGLTGLWEDLADLDGLAAFARGGRRLGFRGMIVIHPSHVPVVNDAFTPSAEEIAFYQGLVAAYEEGAARGEGAVRYGRVHIDKAHYDKAVQWLETRQR